MGQHGESEISSLLLNRSILRLQHGKVYEDCIKSVILYGGETWALTGRLTSILLGCDRVTWTDRVSSLDLVGRCGVRESGTVLRGRRLEWFVHVVRRDEAEGLGKTQLIEVPGRRPPGRPRNTSRKNMQEELASLNLQGEQALNRDQWRTVVNHLTS